MRVMMILALGMVCSVAVGEGETTYPKREKTLQLNISSFGENKQIPQKFAFCIPAKKDHIQQGQNINPHLQWFGLPPGTKSVAIIAVDPDVPSVGDHVNKEDTTVAKNLPRVDFYHWVLVDIPPNITEIKEGQDSSSITPHGKPPGKTLYGVRGINDYTKWFATNDKMAGLYGGYDGPCPPWNDERVHHYHFKIFALDVSTLGLKDNFDGKAAMAAMKDHILGQSEWVGTYTLNPKLKK